MKGIVASLLLVGLAPAQDFAIHVHFAADRDERGPSALSWFRTSCLPRLVSGDVDPLGEIIVSWDGVDWTLRTGKPLPFHYAVGTVHYLGSRLAAFECDAQGASKWSVDRHAVVPNRAWSLIRALGLDNPEAQRFDVGALASQLAGAVAHDAGPFADLLTFGAAACSPVSFVAERSATGVMIHGQGQGGLLLPICVVLGAELHGHPDGGLSSARSIGETERWRMLGYSARHGARTEAIAQLARVGDAQSLAVLERMLWSKSERSAVIEALIRANATHTLPEIVELASDDPLERQLARAAISNFGDDSGSTARSRVRNSRSNHATLLENWRPIALLGLAGAMVFFLNQYLRARRGA